MVDKNVSEAALTLLTSFQEANRKLAERFFTEGMEVLKFQRKHSEVQYDHMV